METDISTDREYVFIFETCTEYLNEEILSKPQRTERLEGYSLPKISLDLKLMLKRQPTFWKVKKNHLKNLMA